MNKILTSLLAAAVWFPPTALAGETEQNRPRGGRHGSVVLDGVPVQVWWNDGDSFTPRRGGREKPVRIVGYNTLETHGPVHQWGTWTAADLLALSMRATQVAAAKVRQCTSEGRPDAYGRPLVRCSDVARELVRQGLAMVFAVQEPPDPELLALQAASQAHRQGMWAGGVPETIVTSVHSQDENTALAVRMGVANRRRDAHPRERAVAYNRVVNTRTGGSERRRHGRTFQICEVVCEGAGQDRSCMTYVPFGRQRREQPPCLR